MHRKRCGGDKRGVRIGPLNSCLFALYFVFCAVLRVAFSIMQAEKSVFLRKIRKLLMMWWCFDRTRVWFCAGGAVFLLTYPVFWGGHPMAVGRC